MTKKSSKNATILVNGVNVSTAAVTYDISDGNSLVEGTGFDDSITNYTPGQNAQSVTVDLWFDDSISSAGSMSFFRALASQKTPFPIVIQPVVNGETFTMNSLIDGGLVIHGEAQGKPLSLGTVKFVPAANAPGTWTTAPVPTPPPTPTYWIYDDFGDVHAGGALNQTVAIAPNGIICALSNVIRTVTDTNFKISTTASGQLNFATGEAVNDGVWYPSFARTPGLVLKATVTPTDTNGVYAIGWDSDQAGTPIDSLQFAAAGVINAIPNGGSAVAVGTYAAGVTYEVVVVTRANGSYYFIQGGNYNTYTLLWITSVASAATYPAIVAGSTTAIFTVSDLRVFYQNITVYPILYDTFTRSGVIGSTESFGPDGQAVESQPWNSGQYGSGQLSGNAMANVGSLEAELTTDGGLEVWTNTTTLTNWTKSLSGTSTLNKEASVIHGGSFAARLDIDSGNDSALIYQNTTPNVAAGDIVKATFWAKSNVNGSAIAISDNGGDNVSADIPLTTSYALYTVYFRALGASIGFKRRNAPSASIYLDDASFKRQKIVSCLVDVNASNANYIMEADFTIPLGTIAGFIMNMDSDLDVINTGNREMQNYRMVILDRVNIAVTEIASVSSPGTYDTLISSTAYTHVDGARLRVVNDGTSLTVYYNGAKIGSVNTMSASVSTLCGLFLPDITTLADNFQVIPLGNNGEHAALGSY